MAQAPQQPSGDAAANFVRQVVSDPKNVPDVTLLTGYLGASSEEAHERLYLSPDLTNYVEIPKAAILHQAPLPKEQDAHGGVTLWVKKDAALQYKMAPAAQALANYFAGAIQAGAQAAAPAGPLPVTVGGPACGGTLLDGCQRPTLDCTAFGAACRTPGVDCTFRCTVFGPGCQSHVHSCAPCVTQNRTPCPAASCGIDCTVVGPACGSHFHTCPPCVINTPFCTQNRTPCPQVSCGIDCTVVGPACQSIHVGTCFVQCRPTRFEPDCPFPTEVTCVPVCHTRPGICPLPQVAAQPLQPGTFAQAVCPVTLPNVCRVTQVHTCGCTAVRTPCPQVSCGIDCNVTQQRTPCPAVSCGIDCNLTQQHTPCPAVSCGIDCTVLGPACQTHHAFCIPTRNQPGCPFPSEICTHVGACNTPHPAICPLPQVAAAAGAGPQANTFVGCRSFVDCSIICPTHIGPCLSHHFTCVPCVTQHPVQCTIACPTRLDSCNPACQITRFEVSCNLACNVTNAAFCPVASGPACPPVSLGACGGFPGQPGFGGQAAQADTAFFFGPCQHTNVTRCCLM